MRGSAMSPRGSATPCRQACGWARIADFGAARQMWQTSYLAQSAEEGSLPLLLVRNRRICVRAPATGGAGAAGHASLDHTDITRSEKRRGGQEGVRPCKYRG